MSMNTIASRLIRFSSIWLILFGYVLSNPLWAAESALQNAKNLLVLLDAAEAGHDAGVSQNSLLERLEQTEKALASFLKANPDNADALIISARLDRSNLIMRPVIYSPDGEMPNQSSAYVPIHGKLDRAIALQPNNAEAHYWKARIYGLRHPVIRHGTFYMEVANLEQAIQFARKAVELEPTNVAYREALALYLIRADKSEQALEVMRTIANGQHPIYLLLNDLKTVPIPSTALLSAVDSENIAGIALEGGMIHNYPQLRVHVYVVPMPLAGLQEFYAGHWAGFEFFSVHENTLQLLMRKGDVLQPARAASEIPPEPSTGISMMVIEDSCRSLVDELEGRGDVTSELKKKPNENDRCCRLIVINLRQLN